MKQKPQEQISFTTEQVSRLVGASQRQLEYWDKTGLVHPSLHVSVALGSPDRYSITDIFELKIIVKLRKTLPLQRIRSSFHFLRQLPRPLDSIFVVTDGKSIYFYNNEAVLVDTLKQGQTVLQFAVQDLIAEVQAGLKKSHKRKLK